MIVEILFWLMVLLVLHTYMFYPLILNLLALAKKQNQLIYLPSEDGLPTLAVVMAAFNEEKVIRQKLESIYQTNYPLQKLNVYVGSDNSSDGTNNILLELKERFDGLNIKIYEHRKGKANIINHLCSLTDAEAIILTDANVIFTPSTFYELVKHFKNEEIGVVGANIINTNIKNSGISVQEKTYLVNENKMKYHEGLVWGTMVGAFGGCYAIRRKNYHPVPQNFFMDDFYITMHALSDGIKAINELKAICYEDVSNQLKEEFRRKIRISIGNFQNLNAFKHLIVSKTKGLSFAFISHKILRWYTPFFMLAGLIFLSILAAASPFYFFLMCFSVIFLALPLIDFLLRKINIHILLLRFITHFLSMNLALLIGYFKYKKGVKSNVWQPTKRNQ